MIYGRRDGRAGEKSVRFSSFGAVFGFRETGRLLHGNSIVFASLETRKPLGKSAHFGADR